MTVISLRHAFGWVLLLTSMFAMFYLIVPLIVVVASSFGDTSYLSFPPQGFSLRWYGIVFDNAHFLSAFLTSIRIALITTALALLIGIPAAYAIVRRSFPGSRVLEGLFLSPLMLPGLILAVALTMFFSRTGTLTSGTSRLILAHLTMCVPCVLRVAIPTFQRLDRSIEEAAHNLGAHPVQAFFLVSLPAVKPGILAAAALSFIMSFDEVEMAVFLASPREPTLTVALYSAAQMAIDPVLASVSSLLIVTVFVLMVLSQVLRRNWRVR